MIYPKILQQRKLKLSPRWIFFPIPTTYGRKEYLELSDKPINCQLAGDVPSTGHCAAGQTDTSLEPGAHFQPVPSCPASFQVGVRIHPGVKTNFSEEGPLGFALAVPPQPCVWVDLEGFLFLQVLLCQTSELVGARVRRISA